MLLNKVMEEQPQCCVGKCSICNERIFTNSFAALANCQHQDCFHFDCLSKFVEDNQKCPTCEKPAFATGIIKPIITQPQPQPSTSKEVGHLSICLLQFIANPIHKKYFLFIFSNIFFAIVPITNSDGERFSYRS